MNKTKKIASILLVLTIFCSTFSMSVIQASAKVIKKKTGDCYYKYNTSTKVMHIYGNGKMGGNEFFSEPPIENMKKLIVEEGVTCIDGEAFFACDNLIEVSISSTVKIIIGNKIGGSFFNGNLKKITVSKNNKKYSSKDGVLFDKKKTILYQYPPKKSTKSYTVPNSVKTIGKNAFENSSKLKTVTMGNKVTTVGKYAFSECKALTTVKLNNVKTIRHDAFSGCVKLKKIILNKKLKKIEMRAFEGCENISGYLGLPDSVTEVGEMAFYNCTNLKGVVISSKLKKFGYLCFGYIDFDARYAEIVNKKFTIYGKKGSAAQKYAKNNKIKFVAI